mmetsp:Transcript_124145/g.247341  ORF Transcript_124145/g.247341 Transcript_124145/m.247341 type:complete len:116 (+) Transcript_124145:506-853(+)
MRKLWHPKSNGTIRGGQLASSMSVAQHSEGRSALESVGLARSNSQSPRGEEHVRGADGSELLGHERGRLEAVKKPRGTGWPFLIFTVVPSASLVDPTLQCTTGSRTSFMEALCPI